MSDPVSKIKWSSDEYTLEKFVDLFPLPQVVRIKTNPKGNNERESQPGNSLSHDVFILHAVRRDKEVIRASDSLKNEFYLPNDSSAKVEVIWKDFKNVYDNVNELFKHFPKHVLVVEEDETLGIKKGDVLKLKKKIKIRDNSFLKCAFLDANRADVDIPFDYKGVFKTLGDLTSENIPLREAVEFCRLPRTVRFIDDKLKMKRIDGTSKCPTLLSNLEHVTLHEVIGHVDVIASQFLDGQVVVSSIPLFEDIIVNAPAAESRGDLDYTCICQTIDKKTTEKMVEEIGILHEHWIVFEEDGAKGSYSWNQQFFSLSSPRMQFIPHDNKAPFLPPKIRYPVSEKQEARAPPIPPRIPLHPRMGQGRELTPPGRRRASIEPIDPTSIKNKSKTLPRIRNPSQPTHNKEEDYTITVVTSKLAKDDKPPFIEAKLQDTERRIKDKFNPLDLEEEGGYVKMNGNVSHLQTKYDIIYESIHRQAQADYSNFTSDQENQGQQQNELKPPERARSKSDMSSETRSKMKMNSKDVSKLQKRRSHDPQDPRSQSQGATFPRQSQGGSMENTIPADDSIHAYSKDVFCTVRVEEDGQNRGLYSEIPCFGMQADRVNHMAPMLKHAQKKPKAPPGLDFINAKSVNRWSSPEVLAFLKFIKLEKYQKVFKQRKIDGEMLANLNKKELHELHITHPHAATIMKLVHECIKHENSTIPNQYVP